MCGRFSLLTNVKVLIERFKIDEAEVRPEPRYNVAPAQMVTAVIDAASRHLVSMRWGLIPHWAKDPKIGSKMINARAETVAEKGVFKPALKKRRCLVLADGFYEWQKVGSTKKPMYIRMKTREPFALAGLYEKWKSPSEKIIQSCTIITTEPNTLMKPIHNRMPVILKKKDEEAWLDSTNEDLNALTKLLKKYPANKMEAYEVSTYVNSPKNTGSQCIRPSAQTTLDF
ncbi:MAG: SOS response-associated peptidase [Candidatus Thorarchaeota archaeon]|jgi:putative SOS response-associated peptidase YedK